MPYGISIFELTAILASAAVAVGMFLWGSSQLRWSVAILICVSLAAMLTPADAFSMLTVTVALAGVYLLGTQHGSRSSATAG